MGRHGLHVIFDDKEALMQTRVELNSIANKIYMFDEVYPYRAAQEQAEKKKRSEKKKSPIKKPWGVKSVSGLPTYL